MSNNQAILPLVTERLLLRAWQYSDADAVHRYVSDAEVATMTARIPHPYPEGEAAKFLKKSIPAHERGEYFAAAIILNKGKSEGELIGSITLSGLASEEIEIGYWLGKPFWGQGLMSEAVAAFVEVSFSQFMAKVLIADTDPGNAASKKVLLKAGFKNVGTGVCETPARKQGSMVSDLFKLRRVDWVELRK